MSNEKYYVIYNFENNLIIEKYNTKEDAQDVLLELLNISDITNIRVLLGKEVQFTTTQKIIDVKLNNDIQKEDHVKHYCEFCDNVCNNLTCDPYLYEMDNDEDKYWMCGECIEQRKGWLEGSF